MNISTLLNAPEGFSSKSRWGNFASADFVLGALWSHEQAHYISCVKEQPSGKTLLHLQLETLTERLLHDPSRLINDQINILELIDRLLNNGADLHAQDDRGLTPLDVLLLHMRDLAPCLVCGDGSKIVQQESVREELLTWWLRTLRLKGFNTYAYTRNEADEHYHTIRSSFWCKHKWTWVCTRAFVNNRDSDDAQVVWEVFQYLDVDFRNVCCQNLSVDHDAAAEARWGWKISLEDRKDGSSPSWLITRCSREALRRQLGANIFEIGYKCFLPSFHLYTHLPDGGLLDTDIPGNWRDLSFVGQTPWEP